MFNYGGCHNKQALKLAGVLERSNQVLSKKAELADSIKLSEKSLFTCILTSDKTIRILYTLR